MTLWRKHRRAVRRNNQRRRPNTSDHWRSDGKFAAPYGHRPGPHLPAHDFPGHGRQQIGASRRPL